MIDNIINDINGKEKVLILGFGREGKSTYSLIRKYLKDKKLTIGDANKELINNNPELKEDHNLAFVLGDSYLDDLDSYDLIIKSPGVNFKHVNYDGFKDKITSQIDLFLKHANCLTIGVTGTKGKSTTSSLIYYVLKNMNKRTVLLGNIGIPVFDEIENITKDTLVVLELSCHQLQFVNASPNISVLLNIYEEHLDLYKSYLDYQLAKLNIFKYQKDGDYSVWGLDSKDSLKWFKPSLYSYEFSCGSKKVKTGIAIEKDALYLVKNDDKIKVYDRTRKRNLLGDHNLYNVAACICVCDVLGLDLNVVSDLIDEFKPLEHRMELVGTFNGITFYNDSIATIPAATINCIKSIPNTSTVIIGGMNRGLDLSDLTKYLNDNNDLKTLIFLKDTGYIMCDELEKLGCTKKLIKAKDMKDAVKNAYLCTPKNHSCVLSPAAASYNTYKNFEERGKDYKRWIKELK